MKPSPLQLEWLIYPAASFQALDMGPEPAGAVPVKVFAHVTYHRDTSHSVELTLHSDDEQAQNAPYTFKVEAVASFTFDLAQARVAYGNTPPPALPQVIAVNVARIVYSAARELLATLTARAPHGSVFVESVLIGPEDVQIRSVEPQEKVLQALFGVKTPGSAKKTAVRRQPKPKAGDASPQD